jgi:hypothetical protein
MGGATSKPKSGPLSAQGGRSVFIRAADAALSRRSLRQDDGFGVFCSGSRLGAPHMRRAGRLQWRPVGWE